MSSLVKNGRYYSLDFYNKTKTPHRKRVPLRVSKRRDAERLQARYDYEVAAGTRDPWAPPEALETPATAPATMNTHVAPDELQGSVARAREGFYESRAHRSKATMRTYRDIVGRFTASLDGDRLVSTIEASDVERWLDSTPAGDTTRRTYTKHLSTFFRWCRERGHCSADVTVDVRLRRVPRRFPKALTENQVARLLDRIAAAGEKAAWFHDLCRFAVHSGMRRGELVALRWRAVNLDTGLVTVECSAGTGPDDGFQTKGGAERKLPLSGEPVEVLRARAAAQGMDLHPDRPVFHYMRDLTGPRKMDGDTVGHKYCGFARSAGIAPASGSTGGIHALRHTAITRLIERGVPVPIVQQFAGHADIATTMRYCSVADDVYADRIRAALVT